MSYRIVPQLSNPTPARQVRATFPSLSLATPEALREQLLKNLTGLVPPATYGHPHLEGLSAPYLVRLRGAWLRRIPEELAVCLCRHPLLSASLHCSHHLHATVAPAQVNVDGSRVRAGVPGTRPALFWSTALWDRNVSFWKPAMVKVGGQGRCREGVQGSPRPTTSTPLALVASWCPARGL